MVQKWDKIAKKLLGHRLLESLAGKRNEMEICGCSLLNEQTILRIFFF